MWFSLGEPLAGLSFGSFLYVNLVIPRARDASERILLLAFIVENRAYFT